ncbi:MAG TPA: bifunctional acyl-ACP--phospholipid O-acyltransferase/long-chain-fatty-acid--ACP ligase [Bryobacteraceae bacterium]|nr:bifunctional acyl-ACP--phospholipid O-acyltransferase/long-chain-fatty-acid--ACP ligase [Bryobacteraceae bacterium]
MFTRLLFDVRVSGKLQPADKLLVVCNHKSFLDGILLGAWLPIRPTYLVHSSIARLWYFKMGLQFLPHLVVDTNSPLAIKAIVHLIDSGTPVVIFPEGRISVTGSMMKIYDGPAFVAARTGATVVPVHLEGPEFSYASKVTGDFPKMLFPKIRLHIGQPQRLLMPEAPTAKERRRISSERLRRIMQRESFEARHNETLFEAFVRAIEIYERRRDILEDIQKNQTYGDLLKASLALGRLVGKLSQPGETVGVLMPNVSTTVSLLFGMFATRRVPAMLNFTAGPDGVRSACELAQVKLVVTSRAFVERAKLANLIAALGSLRVVYLEDLRPMFGLGDKLWLMLWALHNPLSTMVPTKPEDPAVVLFTSGSEGRPKGVVLTHASLLANAAQVRSVISFSSKDKFLSALPMFHAFGLLGGIVLPLLNGARIFLYPSPLHYRIVPETVYDRDCTVLFSTNTFLANYAKFAHPYDFYNLRYLVVGAEKLGDDVRQLCMDKFGVRVLEGYGATECSPVITLSTPMANRPGSVGELMPGMEARLEPVEGIDEGGILHVRGPNVMAGYLKHERPGQIEPPQSIFGEGWYNTGDVVTIDEKGLLDIKGRMKRFAKVAGEMVSLEVVEQVAIATQPRYQHAAIAIKDFRRGEALLLFTEDRGLTREQLQTKVRELGLPELVLPRRVVHLDTIPLLGNGKKDYVRLRQMADELDQSASKAVEERAGERA